MGADCFFGKAFDDIKFDGTDAENEEDDGRGSAVAWKRFRVNAVRTCEIMMGGALNEWEKEMFLFPRACRRCHSASAKGMRECADCAGVAYCGDACLEEDREDHEGDKCTELRFAMACDNFESTVSVAAPPIPSQVDAAFTQLPPDMDAFVRKFCPRVASVDDSMAALERRFLSDRLSGPLTIVHSLNRYGLAGGKASSRCPDLTVHVVGANIMEMLGIIKWELVAHRLPALKSLRLVFVGPELENEEDGECEGLGECSDCSDRGRTVTYEIRRSLYSDYAKSGSYRPPDVVAAFNCGFHEYESEPAKETWSPSLPLLLRHTGVPLILTSYTETEAAKDLNLVRKAAKEVQGQLREDVSGQRNPFRSHRPIRDFECDGGNDVFYSNNYYSVVRRTS